MLVVIIDSINTITSPEPTIYPYVYALHLSGVVVVWSDCRAPPVHPITYHTS